MMTLEGCPRCGGAVLDYGHGAADSPLCITCGWRRRDVPLAVQAEVAEHLGKSLIKERHAPRCSVEQEPASARLTARSRVGDGADLDWDEAEPVTRVAAT
jgi:hypothetical protein